jgi:hypothetical protein
MEFPTGSGKRMNLGQIATELAARLTSLFLPDANGTRPCHGKERRYAEDPTFRDLLLFNEYFDGDNGAGVGATHQTGWTALVIGCIETIAKQRDLTQAAAAE